MLDPAQNHTFRDHYLEVDLDLSDVLFIATANVLDTIPGPLLDRMEVIRLDGYTDDEKVAIARDHLLGPPARAATACAPTRSTSPTTRCAASSPTTPARPACGTSSASSARCCARPRPQVAAGDDTPVTVDVERPAPTYLGRPGSRRERPTATAVPGVVNGLAVTGAGGDVLVVEATSMDGRAGLTLTGQLGDVMNESGQIALSYIRSQARRARHRPAGAVQRRFHVHFPAGAVPKDGPSAGVTMTTALVSCSPAARCSPRSG